VSIALQHGVPLETFVDKFTNLRFEPAGMTTDPDIRMAQSVMDYVFRRLALDHLPFESRAALGIYTTAERTRQLETGSYEEAESEDHDFLSQSAGKTSAHAPAAVSAPIAAPVVRTAVPARAAHSTAELAELMSGRISDAPLCMACGIKMRPSGSCNVCEGCGATSGCS
jgi:ribonucleoside-diphosphate reductase alpha chain